MDKPENTAASPATSPSGPSSPPLAADSRSLDKSLVGGIAWTAAAKWSSQVLSWASTLVVARLLMPSDFGLVGLTMVYVGFVQLFSEFGFGTAIITLRELTEEQVKQINTVALVSGAVGFVVSWGIAGALGQFFKAPQLPPIMVVMSLAFVISGFRVVPHALLQKEMRFKLLSLMEAAQSLAQALGTLALALLGLGYWALVLGNLIGTAMAAGLAVAWNPQAFARPRLRSIKRALIFSWHIFASRAAWYVYSDADFLIAARVLGAAALGAYTFAWNLATMPIEKVTDLVTRVMPPFFSAVQTEHAALRRYLRTLTEALSIITFPATLGIALVANEFVPLALGKKWEGVILPLELLAFYASFRSITTLLPQVLIAVGKSRFVMWINVAALVLLPSSFYIGSWWGTAGIASAWVVVYPFIAVPLYRRTFRDINMSRREYLGAIRPALRGSVAMAALVGTLKWTLPSLWPLYLRFGLEVLSGSTAYILTLVIFHRERMRVFLGLLGSLRG